jgi:hypothetical protein
MKVAIAQIEAIKNSCLPAGRCSSNQDKFVKVVAPGLATPPQYLDNNK